jgi:predicted house-cleaning noncanonical NTP pyrophosphatase (MazG superfamily)
MKKVYEKLVRDKIPEIINKGGNKCVIATLSDEEYCKKLEEKLFEEVNEFKSDKTVEELADILEVVYALAKNMGVSKTELEDLRLKKANSRGGFEEKILLKWVEGRE